MENIVIILMDKQVNWLRKMIMVKGSNLSLKDKAQGLGILCGGKIALVKG